MKSGSFGIHSRMFTPNDVHLREKIDGWSCQVPYISWSSVGRTLVGILPVTQTTKSTIVKTCKDHLSPIEGYTTSGMEEPLRSKPRASGVFSVDIPESCRYPTWLRLCSAPVEAIHHSPAPLARHAETFVIRCLSEELRSFDRNSRLPTPLKSVTCFFMGFSSWVLQFYMFQDNPAPRISLHWTLEAPM